MAGKYDDIDKMILERITDKPRQFSEIFDAKLCHECVLIVGPKG